MWQCIESLGRAEQASGQEQETEQDDTDEETN